MIDTTEFIEYKESVMTEAKRILNEVFPKQITELTLLLNTKFNTDINEKLVEELKKLGLNDPQNECYFIKKISSSDDGESERPENEKGEDDSDSSTDSLDEKSPSSGQGEGDAKSGDAKSNGEASKSDDKVIGEEKISSEEKESQTNAPTKMPKKPKIAIVDNEDLCEINEILKPLLQSFVENSKSLKNWIQFLIPGIEDGNNFGVEVQEKVKKEVSVAISVMSEFLRQIFIYTDSRGRMGARVIRFPEVMSYKRSIIEYDQQHFYRLRMAVLELRTKIAHLLDTINKNYQKIIQPKTNNCENIY